MCYISKQWEGNRFLFYISNPQQTFHIITPTTSQVHILKMGTQNWSVRTSVRSELARVVGMPTLGYLLCLGINVSPPYSARHLLALLSFYRRSTGFLDHLPGHVVQCRGTHVPVSGRLLIFTIGVWQIFLLFIGLQLVPKMYHSGLCAKGNPEDWFGVAERYINLLFVPLHHRNFLDYIFNLRIRLLEPPKSLTSALLRVSMRFSVFMESLIQKPQLH